MKPEPIYKSIGATIRARRRQLEWPQEKLARHLGVSRATLANIETGRQRILVHQIYAFAEVFGVKPNDLLPMSPGSGSAAQRTRLPMPEDLNPQQKEQIARLIETTQISTSNSTEK